MNSLREVLERDLSEAVSVFEELKSDEKIKSQLLSLAGACSSTLSSGGLIFFAGNGGSFADAQHMAAEFSGKLGRPRKPLASLALGTNSSSMSAIGNDFDFENVFSRELEAFQRDNSIVIAFSTSGKSKNLVQLQKKADELSIPFWALTGSSSGDLVGENVIHVPSQRTERIQEMHTTLGHILCFLIEEELEIF